MQIHLLYLIPQSAFAFDMPGEEVWSCSVIPVSPEKIVIAQTVKTLRYSQAIVNTVEGTSKSPHCIILHSNGAAKLKALWKILL